MQIILPQKPKIIKSEGNRAVLEIEGLYPGYGITLGNALRRVLLSSLPGAAITGVKIKGAPHEFSTIPYMMEDVIEIILNLKQIRFKLFGNQAVKLTLNVKGAKEVKAGDFKTTSEVEIINKEAPVATLTDKRAELEMEIDVEAGLGFVPVEQRKKQKLEIGLIAVDAVFTPLRRVNFEVENMRVGDRTDYNRLIFDIETDGSIEPAEAFKKAGDILVEQFKVFAEKENGEAKEVGADLAEKNKPAAGEDKEVKVEEMKLSARTANSLGKGGVRTAGDLIDKTEADLKEMSGMGAKGIGEIKKALKKLGLGLKE